MASLFKKEVVAVQKKSEVDVVRDSLDVDAAGVVRFRSRTGRGSGKAIEIPGDQFDEFVTLMVKVRDNREQLANEERSKVAPVAETVVETDNTPVD